MASKALPNLIYENQKRKFPLIASVLEGTQKGQIFKNNEEKPTHFFVINKFGFCQEFFSEYEEGFFSKIKKFILERKYKKLRCYAPSGMFESFLDSIEFSQKSERIQFKFISLPQQIDDQESFRIQKVNRQILKSIDFGLDLKNRYWNGESDFISNANPFAVFFNGEAIGVCYSAGNGLDKAEVDVFVDDRYRKQNVGYLLALKFISECLKKKIIPSWDCYSNNLNSIRLAQKLGFEEEFKYSFYNINGDN